MEFTSGISLEAFVSIVALAVTMLGFVIRTSIRLGALELKVDTMWGFQMRRSMSEVITSGQGILNSPLVIKSDALEHLKPLKSDLQKLYQEQHSTIGDASMLLKIEEKFGDIILDLVCLPCGVSYGACLIIALAVAKGSNELNLRVSEDRK
jgi:hypothetical protein